MSSVLLNVQSLRWNRRIIDGSLAEFDGLPAADGDEAVVSG